MNGHGDEIDLAGKKRHASDGLENEQRLTKRFSTLRIGKNGKPYIAKTTTNQKQARQKEDGMQVDDTKHRVYIHDLDAELSDTDSEKDLVFIPDIEKRLTKIPRSVLLHKDSTPVHNEMVLYNVPHSLTVPEENDSTRKAILEARSRAQEKSLQDVYSTKSPSLEARPGPFQRLETDQVTLGSGEAMDID